MKFSSSIVSVVSLVSVVALSFVAGCSGSPEESSSESAASQDVTAAQLAGTYSLSSATNETEFNSLTLYSNHRFSAEGGCRQDVAPTCHAITSIKGTYATKGTSSTSGEMIFTDQFKQVTTYYYSVEGNELVLGTSATGTASSFSKTK